MLARALRRHEEDICHHGTVLEGDLKVAREQY
jgi:hypothetical protein